MLITVFINKLPVYLIEHHLFENFMETLSKINKLNYRILRSGRRARMKGYRKIIKRKPWRNATRNKMRNKRRKNA